MKKLLQLITKPNDLQYHELLLRLYMGAAMTWHGQGKLFNLDGTAMFFSKIGVEPAYPMAVMASIGETFGGIAVMLGFLLVLVHLLTVSHYPLLSFCWDGQTASMFV